MARCYYLTPTEYRPKPSLLHQLHATPLFYGL